MQDGWPRADGTQVTDLAAPSNALRSGCIRLVSLRRHGEFIFQSRVLHKGSGTIASEPVALGTVNHDVCRAFLLTTPEPPASQTVLYLKTAVCTQP